MSQARLRLRNRAEIALDALWIDNGNLNVIAHSKAGPFIKRLIFREWSAHRIVRGQPIVCPVQMKRLDHLAIQLALETIFAAGVTWQSLT